jgi:hypothetical protein
MQGRSTDGYIASCQKSKVEDPTQTSYVGGMSAAALVSKAITAYDHGRHRDALDLFGNALSGDGGNHLLIYNGLYLTNLRLGRHAAANEVSSSWLITVSSTTKWPLSSFSNRERQHTRLIVGSAALIGRG